MDAKTGHWAFLVGVALCVIAGFVPQLQTYKITWVIVFLGLIVGLLNITAKETQEFLIAAVALIIAADVAGDIIALGSIAPIFGNIITFVFPAALIVALKTIWELASS
jgi:hypothetical protein